MIAYIFLLAAVLVMARLLRGPSFADRALAANALVDIIALFMVFYTFTVQAQADQPGYMSAVVTDVVVVSATQITATTSASTAGVKDVVVTTTVGGSGTLAGGFTYE